MSHSPLLEVRDLKVVFPTPHGDVRAVWGIDFKVDRGQIYGIVGESGCGKTATGRAILKLLPPPGKIADGQILFHGEDLVQKDEQGMRRLRGKRIAMVFQDPAAALNPLFTIGQQLFSIMKRHQISDGDDLLQRAEKLLLDLGLPNPDEILNCYPHHLSGGMQQRAMIAMALSAEPDLIIADEPTSSLDVTIQSQILDLLAKLRQERGVTIILITHDLGVVAETCEQVAVFYLGKIVEKGTTRDIFHNPKHPYTQGLLAALPNPETWGDDLKVIPGTVPTNIEIIPGCSFASRCEFVMEVCRSSEPQIIEINHSHQTACHLYEDSIKGEIGVGS
jgi:oligopeptide/dipeptide ABC transporter ATP-binding protein